MRLPLLGGDIRDHGDLFVALKDAAEERGRIYTIFDFHNCIITHLRVQPFEKLAHVCGG